MKKTSLAIHSHFPKSPQPRFSPRIKPVQGRSQATVDAILEAASQVLIRFEYESANTTLIAHKAGVSVGSLYQYFPNKLE